MVSSTDGDADDSALFYWSADWGLKPDQHLPLLFLLRLKWSSWWKISIFLQEQEKSPVFSSVLQIFFIYCLDWLYNGSTMGIFVSYFEKNLNIP